MSTILDYRASHAKKALEAKRDFGTPIKRYAGDAGIPYSTLNEWIADYKEKNPEWAQSPSEEKEERGK